VRILFYQLRFDEALETAELLLAKDPSVPYLRGWIVAILSHQDRAAEALQYAQDEPVLFARLTALAITHHALGNLDEAEAAQQELEEAYRDLAAAQQAWIFAHWGEFETAIDWLEIAVDIHDSGIIDLKTDPSFARMRGHPRYEALLRKMNVTASSAND
jgi:tetratricopeptide (TPR) repeat protein